MKQNVAERIKIGSIALHTCKKTQKGRAGESLVLTYTGCIKLCCSPSFPMEDLSVKTY